MKVILDWFVYLEVFPMRNCFDSFEVDVGSSLLLFGRIRSCYAYWCWYRLFQLWIVSKNLYVTILFWTFLELWVVRETTTLVDKWLNILLEWSKWSKILVLRKSLSRNREEGVNAEIWPYYCFYNLESSFIFQVVTFSSSKTYSKNLGYHLI